VFRDADGALAVHTGTHRFHGDRNRVREQAADYALGRLPTLHAAGANA
jgi:hypothetical protein